MDDLWLPLQVYTCSFFFESWESIEEQMMSFSWDIYIYDYSPTN